MNVSAPMGINTAQQKSNMATGANVDYQSFLKLLVAEMKNQDPTNPMDSSDYVAQLATFSQVEQSVQINAKFDQLLRASALGQADAIIGRTVTSADGKISGVVEEVRVASAGIVAILADGKEMPVVAGVKIS